MSSTELSFLNYDCNGDTKVSLCEAAIELSLNYAMLEGDNFILLYFVDTDSVRKVWRVPKVVFTEYAATLQHLGFMTLPIWFKGLRENVVLKHISEIMSGAQITFKDACKTYQGDAKIIKLYDTSDDVVYAYKENCRYDVKYVVFEVINFEEQSNKNSCIIPLEVYKEIVDILDRR